MAAVTPLVPSDIATNVGSQSATSRPAFAPTFASLQSNGSNFRAVFQTSDQMQKEFTKFLTTIFYQLDEKKVLAGMQRLLADPNKTDSDIYQELLSEIHNMKKSHAPLARLWSLFVLKAGMGRQAAQLLKNCHPQKFQNYMEVYDRRYVDVLRAQAGLPLKGNIVAVCDNPAVTLADKIQAGSFLPFSTYPYKRSLPLNEANCTNPALQTELTYKPLGEEVADSSLDLIGCFGGLHHVPEDRVDPFVSSAVRKLRPGGVVLLRDHDITDREGTAKLSQDQLKSIAALVHTFVNAADGVSLAVENAEVREFKSMQDWKVIMQRHGLTPLSNAKLVLKNDPTENAMMAFVKNPLTEQELREAISYRNDCQRPKDGTRATWIEWGNVRFSKQYAEFIQNHHSYAFDYIGHIRQHWQHFYHYFTQSWNDPEVSKQHLFFSDNSAMNLFILITTVIQCSASFALSAPAALMARWKFGERWREVAHLTNLERFHAQTEKEYSEFIDHTPFYMFDYIGKIKAMWSVVYQSQESWAVKASSTLSAIGSTVGFLVNAAISLPVRSIYTAETNLEPDTVKILVKDPNNELEGVITRWEREKDPARDARNKIELIYHTQDGCKLVSIPRYRPFTQICEYIKDAPSLQLMEIGGQKEISVDVLLNHEVATPVVPSAAVVYEMPRLQDAQQRRYVTYQVNVAALKTFQNTVGSENIVYIHE